MSRRKDGKTISFYLRHNVIYMLNRMSDESDCRSRSLFVEEAILNIAELGGMEKLKELRYSKSST